MSASGTQARLAVCIDFKSPHAWLAVPPTRALAQELGIGIDWLPRIAAPIEQPPPATAGDDRGARHRRMRAEYAARDIARYAAVHGLTIGGLYRRPDVSKAALGLLWARRAGPEVATRYVEATFDGHWSERLDIEDPDTIDHLLDEAGAAVAERAAFFADGGRSELDALQERLAEQGAYTTPAYLLADQLFIGRAHLPRLRELILAGALDAGQSDRGVSVPS